MWSSSRFCMSRNWRRIELRAASEAIGDVVSNDGDAGCSAWRAI
jgi:hypothetical protein